MAEDERQGNDLEMQNGDDSALIIPIQRVQSLILLARGQKVILDSDLADLYGVETRTLIQAVKRNRVRFPDDFMFQLAPEEFQGLRSQSVISNGSVGRGGRRYPPYAFTEHGAIMVASVLNSKRAVQTSVFIVRAFVRLRQMLASNEALAARLKRLEKTAGAHSRQIVAIVDTIQLLMPPPEEPPKEPFGFRRARKN